MDRLTQCVSMYKSQSIENRSIITEEPFAIQLNKDTGQNVTPCHILNE